MKTSRKLSTAASSISGGRYQYAKVAAGAFAATALLAGCSLGTPDTTISPNAPTSGSDQSTSQSATGNTNQQDDTESDGGSNPTDNSGNLLEGVSVSPQEAGQIALDSRPTGQVIDIELEHSDGKAVWEVKVLAPEGKWEMYIDVNDGSIVREKDKSHSGHDDDLYLLDTAKLDFVQAIDIMLAEVPGGALTELNLDDHNGGVVWEGDVMVGNQKHEVKIDAVTGDVIKNKIDD